MRAVVLAFLALAAPAAAHPATALVRDSHGNFFYSDLTQVWCLAPDGSTRVVVPGVHTHELSLDSSGQLHGEHLWYEGDATKKWGHYVWRRSPDGRIDKIIPPTEGFRRDYGFVRDAAGNLYSIEPATADPAGPVVIRRRAPTGSLTTLTPHPPLREPRWLACSPNGTLYTVSRGDLVCIDATGTTHILARRLAGDRFYIALLDRHDLQGLCADDRGHVWVAVSDHGVVKKISPDGTVTIADRSPRPYGPHGVLATPDGQLWVLESAGANSTRVRRATSSIP